MEKLKLHPWLTAEGAASEGSVKQAVAEKIMKAREDKRKERHAAQVGANQGKAYKRGDDESDDKFLSSMPFTQPYDNSDLTEWGTTLTPAQFWEEVEKFAADVSLVEAQRQEDKKKFVLVGVDKKVTIKVKFFECTEEKTLKISFIKKEGDLLDFYSVLKDAQEYL